MKLPLRRPNCLEIFFGMVVALIAVATYYKLSLLDGWTQKLLTTQTSYASLSFKNDSFVYSIIFGLLSLCFFVKYVVVRFLLAVSALVFIVLYALDAALFILVRMRLTPTYKDMEAAIQFFELTDQVLESVRKLHEGLQSLRSMRRTEARWM